MQYRLKILALTLLASFWLTACGPQKTDSHTVIVGTIAGPETQLMVVAKNVAKKDYDLNVKIVQFEDYAMPNAALADGSIDANMFQHIPYLKNARRAKGYKLSVVGKVFIYPMGIYSKKIKSLKDLPKGAGVAIPNDPSNEARALLLLQKAGLIKLRPGVGFRATVNDIKSNPKKLKFKTLDAAQLPRVLNDPDIEIAAINTNYAVPAGLLPSRDALVVESKRSPYANVVVVRTKERFQKKFKQLVMALHSKAVQEEAAKLFRGQAIPAWKTK